MSDTKPRLFFGGSRNGQVLQVMSYEDGETPHIVSFPVAKEEERIEPLGVEPAVSVTYEWEQYVRETLQTLQNTYVIYRASTWTIDDVVSKLLETYSNANRL